MREEWPTVPNLGRSLSKIKLFKMAALRSLVTLIRINSADFGGGKAIR